MKKNRIKEPLSLADQLQGQFLIWCDDCFKHTDDIKHADGISFLCPKCFIANNGPIGTHRILCWRPNIGPHISPGPGRWEFTGTGLHNLTLVAGSSSILLTDGCRWHGYVRNGQATSC